LISRLRSTVEPSSRLMHTTQSKRLRLTVSVTCSTRRRSLRAAIIEALQGEGTKTYIPLRNTRCGRNSGNAVGLVYERERDRIRCPADKYLYPSSGNYDNRKRYVSSPADCRSCPRASTCPAKNRKKAPHTRFVLRPNDQDLFDEVQARMRDPTFRQRMSERMWKCEGLFAEAKQNHGLARARYRGRHKVQIQAYLSATSQNLKRLVFLFYCWLISWQSHRRSTATPSRNRYLRRQTFSTRPTLSDTGRSHHRLDR
jgi:hypothetical protein